MNYKGSTYKSKELCFCMLVFFYCMHVRKSADGDLAGFVEESREGV